MFLSLIVDGDHILHRNLHVPKFRELTNSQGYPTGIIFGAMGVLNHLIIHCFDRNIDQVFFLLGEGRENWRRDVFPEYKQKTSEDRSGWYEAEEGDKYSNNDLYQRGRWALEKHLPNLGIRVIKEKYHEADDIAYYIAKKLKSEGRYCIACSDDWDWVQMVNDPGIPVYQPMKERLIERHNFEEHTDVPPEAMVLLLSVVGGHDNLPKTAPGFGEGYTKRMISEIKESNPNAQFTPDEVLEWSKAQTAKTFQKLSTDEAQKRLRTNIKLVDFSRIPFSSEASQSIEDQMARPVKFDPDKAQIFLKKYELNKYASIMGRKKYKVLK